MRERALGISLYQREILDFENIVNDVYGCSLCGACENECENSCSPVKMIIEMRSLTYKQGKLPKTITKLVNNCIDTGNAYGKTKISKRLSAAKARHTAKTDTLFVLGSDAAFIEPDVSLSAIKLLEKSNVQFTMLENELPSGSQLGFLTGDNDKVKSLCEAFAKEVSGYKTVVFYDPADLAFLRLKYKQYGIKVKANAVSFISILTKLIKNGSIQLKKSDKTAVLQDSFWLSRYLDETNEIRKVLAFIADLKEMLSNRKQTVFAGDILMSQWMPDGIKRLAQSRMFDAIKTGADILITESISEYHALKLVAKDNFSVMTVEQFVLNNLKK